MRLADVVSPPYDVIDDDLRRRLLARSPYNVVHLILPQPGEEREAGDTFAEWRREGVVVREPRPCMYWLEQHARGPDGVRRRRAGLIAALRLEPYAPGRIRRHERTLDAPKAGRLAVLRAVRANLSPIFMSLRRPVAADQRDLRAARRLARSDLRGDRRGGHLASPLARVRGHPRARGDRRRRQPAAHDRRRPSPLRDGTRLPQRAARWPTAIRPSSWPTTSRRSTWPIATTRGSCSSRRTASCAASIRSCGSVSPSCWPNAGSSRRSPI